MSSVPVSISCSQTLSSTSSSLCFSAHALSVLCCCLIRLLCLETKVLPVLFYLLSPPFFTCFESCKVPICISLRLSNPSILSCYSVSCLVCLASFCKRHQDTYQFDFWVLAVLFCSSSIDSENISNMRMNNLLSGWWLQKVIREAYIVSDKNSKPLQGIYYWRALAHLYIFQNW